MKVKEAYPHLYFWFMQYSLKFDSEEGPVTSSISELTFDMIFKLTHPLLNALSRFEGEERTRVVRVKAWMA